MYTIWLCAFIYHVCVYQGVSRPEDGGVEAVLRSYLDGGEDAASHGGPALRGPLTANQRLQGPLTANQRPGGLKRGGSSGGF